MFCKVNEHKLCKVLRQYFLKTVIHHCGSPSSVNCRVHDLNPITPTRMRRNQSRSHETRIEKMAILYLVDL